MSKIDIYLLYNMWTAPNRGSKKLVPGEPQVVPIKHSRHGFKAQLHWAGNIVRRLSPKVADVHGEPKER